MSRVGRELINLTPHEVVVIADDGTQMVSVPASGRVARLRESRTPIRPVRSGGVDVPTVVVTYEDVVEDLPDPAPGVVLIVSRVLAAAVPRADLVFPAGEVRDPGGRMIGCQALGRFPHEGSGAGDEVWQ